MRGHFDRRRRDLGILRDRQREQRDAAGQRDDDRQHRGEDRAVDEEARKHGSSLIFSLDCMLSGPGPAGGRGCRAAARVAAAVTRENNCVRPQHIQRENDRARADRTGGSSAECVDSRPAQAVDDVEEDGRQEDAENRDAQHAAEDGGAQRPRISAPAPWRASAARRRG